MTLRTIACLTVFCLLCAGLCGCQTTEPNVDPATTTTSVADITTTQEDTTTTEDTVAQTTTTVTEDGKTTVATTTASKTETVRTTVPKKTTTTVVTTTATTTQKPVTTTTASKVITALTPLSAKEYYGYTVLKKDNRTAMIEAYERIVQAVEAMETEIDLTTLSKPLTQDELYTVWTYYRLDYPQHFWLSHNGYTCTVSGTTGEVKVVTATYAMTKNERTTKQAAVERAVDAILANVSGNDTLYERERIIHDALCKKVTYNLKAARGHDLDGALVDGKAVCEGYSQAFQYLLYRAGVPCGAVVGKKVDGENHKWNFVTIGNKSYYIDVTWDDVEAKDLSVIHSYFNVSEQLLLRDHVVFKEKSYPLPSFNSMDENYYKKNGTYITKRSVDELGDLLKKGNGTVELYIADGDAEGYYQWFKSNHLQFAQKLGLTSYTYGYSRVGAGVVLYMRSR